MRLGVGAAVGVLVGATVTSAGEWRYGLLLGWMAAAAVSLVWQWWVIVRMDAPTTAAHCLREDLGRKTLDLIVFAAAVASLGAVGLFLAGNNGGAKDVQALVSAGAVAVSWLTAHTMFTTRYARLYYVDDDGGIDFQEDSPPTYLDFAYFAFTIGATFQVSDTNVSRKNIRATVLRHALLSYLFGAVILAVTINLVAGLAK